MSATPVKVQAFRSNGAGHSPSPQALLKRPDQFVQRHLGPRARDLPAMLQTIGVSTLDALIDATVPANIRLTQPLNLPGPRSETEVLEELRTLAAKG